MTSTSFNSSNKPFHTYENVGFEANPHYASNISNVPITSTAITTAIATSNSGIAINKTAIESPFPDPLNGK